MSIKKYTTFLKVVETGSITKAASLLGHTQSGVTQLLHSLEQDLRVQLLTRSRNGIALTPQGKELLPYIKEVVSHNEKLLQAAGALTTPKNTVIKIGAFTSVAVNWLPTIIKEYQKNTPDVKFELIDCGYNQIEQELEAHAVDLGFVPLTSSGGLRCIPLYEDRLLAVLPLDHPFLAGLSNTEITNKRFPVSSFAYYPVISLIPEIDLDARTVFESAHITPNTKYTVEDDYAMLALAKKGLGICVVPELMLRDNADNSIVALELDPPASRTIGIAFPAGTPVKPGIQAFADFIKKWVINNK